MALLLITVITIGQNPVKHIEKLTNIETSYPYWSPDGNKIVFQSNRMDNDSEIYTMKHFS